MLPIDKATRPAAASHTIHVPVLVNGPVPPRERGPLPRQPSRSSCRGGGDGSHCVSRESRHDPVGGAAFFSYENTHTHTHTHTHTGSRRSSSVCVTPLGDLRNEVGVKRAVQSHPARCASATPVFIVAWRAVGGKEIEDRDRSDVVLDWGGTHTHAHGAWAGRKKKKNNNNVTSAREQPESIQSPRTPSSTTPPLARQLSTDFLMQAID